MHISAYSICTSDLHRHASRTVLLELALPEIGHSQSLDEQELWDDLQVTVGNTSAAAGICVCIGTTYVGGERFPRNPGDFYSGCPESPREGATQGGCRGTLHCCGSLPK